MMTTYIYVLCDPDTDEIRYVGKSDNPEKRLIQHCSTKELKYNNHKASWIKSLINKNKYPKLSILEEVEKDIWQDREKYWIQYYRNLGVRLTNQMDGGEGVSSGTKLSVKTRRKISEALRGRPVSEKAKMAIRDRSRNRVWTSDIKEKISNTKKTNWKSLSDELKNKILNPMLEYRRKTKTSKYIGVSFRKERKVWIVAIQYKGKTKILGYFKNEIDAAKRYDEIAPKYFGSSAILNFPSK